MKKIMLMVGIALAGIATSQAQIKINTKAVGAAVKAAQAVTLTDAQLEAYVKEYVKWLDEHNPICEPDDYYAMRLDTIIAPLKNIEGLNFKVYRVVDVNAFACADGSIRVMAGLMEVMSNEEILGVIGHEIGHVRNKDTKAAFKTALLASALRDGVSSQGGTAGQLSDSQFGELGEALTNSQFSQTQENNADDAGYELLKAQGVNPWYMAMAFESLQRLSEEAGAGKSSTVQKAFSSHPDTPARIKRMAAKATADGFERPAAR